MKAFIKPVALFTFVAALTSVSLVGAFHVGLANADTPIVIDAGAAPLLDAGIGSAIAAGSAVGSGSGSDVVKLDVVVSPPMPDPANPMASISMWEKLYKSGAFFALGIVVIFSILYVADEKIAWLREGKRGVYIAAALGGLAIVFVPASQGSTPTLSMFVTALSTAVALIINPKKPDSSSST